MAFMTISFQLHNVVNVGKNELNLVKMDRMLENG